MGYKQYSDSYLMKLTKKELIEMLRVAEHNFFATEETLNNSAKAGTEIAEKFDKAKLLLKKALKVINNNMTKISCKHCFYYDSRCRVDIPCSLQAKWYYEQDVLDLIKE